MCNSLCNYIYFSVHVFISSFKKDEGVWLDHGRVCVWEGGGEISCMLHIKISESLCTANYNI